MKTPDTKSLVLVAVGILVPMLAARGARAVTGKGYSLITNEDPPMNPASPDVEWKDALVWTVVSGIVGALARLVVRRAMADTRLPAEGDDMEDEMQNIA